MKDDSQKIYGNQIVLNYFSFYLAKNFKKSS